MDNRSDILRRLEELMALDNSDKRYLIDSLLQNKEIRDAVVARLTSVIQGLMADNSDDNFVYKVIGDSVKAKTEAIVSTYSQEFDATVQKEFVDATVNSINTVKQKSAEFAGRVEDELRSVLATDVAASLYETLCNKGKNKEGTE